MLKNISVVVLISLIAIICFSLGMISGNYQSKSQLKNMDAAVEKLISSMSGAVDSTLNSREPYSGYTLSLMLFEAAAESNDPPEERLKLIQNILISELSARKNGISEFCKTVSTAEFRELCNRRIAQANMYIGKYNNQILK